MWIDAEETSFALVFAVDELRIQTVSVAAFEVVQLCNWIGAVKLTLV